ncbi:LmeA family phospholipid-binding protein [Streptomyces sp. NPDC093568]|uniref:LmeA family phospholipid-binding protein n=1 Tax=Streptomyces sp. NPDC093568 TaxID=3366041 RepID=UPI00381A5B76
MIRSAFRRHRAAALTSTALAVVLLTATTAELVARTLLHSRMAAVADQALGKGTAVDIEGSPALLALVDRHIDAVTITNDHAALGRIPGVSVHARLEDLRLTTDRSGTVARTHADVTVPAASLQHMAGTSDGGLPVTAVHLDDQADTVTLDLGQGGLGQATLQPRLQDGRVTLHLADVEILGSPAPPRLVDRIQDTLTTRNGVDYPLGLKATTLDVTATGLAVSLDAGPTRLTGKTRA